MGSLANKTPANTYKSLLKVAGESDGVSTTLSNVEDGEGTTTCLKVCDDAFHVRPQNDNSAGTFKVKNSVGGDILSVDSSNNCVKVNQTQTYANTQILSFGAYQLVPTAGTHYFIPCGNGAFTSPMAELANGTGTDPDTTFDAGATTDELVSMLFYAPANITIDGVTAMASTDTDTDTILNVHLYKFTMTNAGGTSDGNLSGGTLLASGLLRFVDRNVLKTTAASIDSSSVSSGEVVACFVENATNTDKVNIRVQVLYHIN